MQQSYIPTCFDCVNAQINPGYHSTFYDPGEPAHLEDCSVFDISLIDIPYDDSDDTEKILAKSCGRFEEIKVTGNCAHCKVALAPVVRREHEWWVYELYADEPSPCCSETCRDELRAEQDKIARQMEEADGGMWRCQ